MKMSICTIDEVPPQVNQKALAIVELQTFSFFSKEL